MPMVSMIVIPMLFVLIHLVAGHVLAKLASPVMEKIVMVSGEQEIVNSNVS